MFFQSHFRFGLQVLLFYRPTAFALWTPYVWNGARVEALQRAMPELFDCATPASSLFIRTLINTYGEKYIAGGCTVPLDATERLSLYFKGDARDAATVLQHLSWCTGRPEVMLLEARYPRIRAFFTCRKRLQFIAIVVSAAKKSRHSEHDLTKAEDSEETQITALLSDPRVCNRAGGGSRLTSPLAAGIARFI